MLGPILYIGHNPKMRVNQLLRQQRHNIYETPTHLLGKF